MFRFFKRYPVFALSGVFILLCLVCQKTGGFEPKLDGRIFLITGERVLRHQWDQIYMPSPGSGPWAYLAPAAQYFTLFSLFFLVLGMWLYLKQVLGVPWQRSSDVWKLCAALGALWFPFWESIYIGQVDISLLFYFVLFLICSKYRKDWLAGAILGLICIFKVQFCIFLLVPLMQKRISQVASFVMTAMGLCGGFYLVHRLSWAQALDHFHSYSTTASAISYVVSPVNQSLRSVAHMLFGNLPYIGRFDPVWYDPRELAYHWIRLPDVFVKGLVGIFRTFILGVTFYFTFKKRACSQGFPLESYLILLAVMPTLSPVFWQVHAVYLILPLLWVAVETSRNRIPTYFFIGACILFCFSNPILIGKKAADWTQSNGAYYWGSLLLLFAMVRKSTNDGTLTPVLLNEPMRKKG